MSTKGVCDSQLKEMLLYNELNMCVYMSTCACTHMYERERENFQLPQEQVPLSYAWVLRCLNSGEQFAIELCVNKIIQNSLLKSWNFK